MAYYIHSRRGVVILNRGFFMKHGKASRALQTTIGDGYQFPTMGFQPVCFISANKGSVTIHLLASGNRLLWQLATLMRCRIKGRIEGRRELNGREKKDKWIAILISY